MIGLAPIPQITYRTPLLNLLNGDFEMGDQSWNKQSGWEINNFGLGQSQPGGTGVWTANYTNTSTTQPGTASIASQQMPCLPGDVISASVWIYQNVNFGTGQFTTSNVRVSWVLSDNSIVIVDGSRNPALNFWFQSMCVVAAPANTVGVVIDVAVYGVFPGGGARINDVTVSGLYSQQTLVFMYAPTGKPQYSKQATRTDTFSTAGNRQTVVQRVNESYVIQMKTILDDGEDLPAWQMFLDWAIQGGQFEYYPDADNEDDHSTCFLVETTAQLAYSTPGCYTFTGTFQKEIT